MRDTSILHRTSAATIVLAIVGLVGCSSGSSPGRGDVRVTEITLGRTLAPDGTIVEDARTNLFWTTDTFYASVATEGTSAHATLRARWTYQDGTVVADDSKTISPSGSAVTAFEAPPPGPDRRWNAGDYKVEVLLDDTSAGVKELNAR